MATSNQVYHCICLPCSLPLCILTPIFTLPRRCCCRSMTNTPLSSILICGPPQRTRPCTTLCEIRPIGHDIHTIPAFRKRIPHVRQWMRCTGNCPSRLRVVFCVSHFLPTCHTIPDYGDVLYFGLCRCTAARLQVLSSGHPMSL